MLTPHFIDHLHPLTEGTVSDMAAFLMFYAMDNGTWRP